MGSSATLIDLAFANQPKNFKTFTQISIPGIATTHDMFYDSYLFPINGNSNIKQYNYVRDFNNVDNEALIRAANSLHWSRLYCLYDVNEQLSLFNAFVMGLFVESNIARKFSSFAIFVIFCMIIGDCIKLNLIDSNISELETKSIV